jgi:hypothetical protein
MDNQIIWSVYNLIRTVPEGVVITVCCNLSMVDGQTKVSGNVNQEVPYKSPSDPGFIPFDQLTEAETIQWVQEQLGPEQIAKYQRALQMSLDERKIKTAQGVPW